MAMTLRALVLAALYLPLGLAQVDEQKVWKDFLTWYRTQPAAGAPADVFQAYARKLTSAGLGEAEINERLAIVRKIGAKEPRELTVIRFNQIFTSPKPPFSTDANAFLVRMVRDLKPGKALVPAMGQGRNAVFLARQGWDVTGYDISDEGLAIARANARKAGVRVNAALKSHEEFDYGKERWDLIVFTYHFAPLSDAGFLKRVCDSLRPGGIVLVEQFNAQPGGNTAKGPANALFKSFENLRVIYYEDATDVSEWGGMKARIGRIAARKE